MSRGFLTPLVTPVLVLACSSGPAGPSTTATVPFAEQVATAHFRVLTDSVDAATCRAIASALEAEYPRITADLGSPNLPVLSAWVWAGQAAFEAAMRANLGVSYPGTTGYVFGGTNLAVVTGTSVTRTATHEFAHLVSLGVNPRFGNNPRWLWETVAVYENGEFIDPATLDYMRAGRYPTLSALDSTVTTSHQVYEVGYVLAEFIVRTWGREALVRLVQTNGDIESVLGLTAGRFEERWWEWVRGTYL